jgi:hypothetical protein
MLSDCTFGLSERIGCKLDKIATTAKIFETLELMFARQ